MKSTMNELPLAISRILQFGRTEHADATVETWTGEGHRTATFAEVGDRAAQLAHALRGIGIDADQRVATFMFNNQEHLEAYLAIPSMGAVLHTLNIRLFAEQLKYIVNHAADEVIIVDGALVPLFAPLLAEFTTVKHVVVTGGADPSAGNVREWRKTWLPTSISPISSTAAAAPARPVFRTTSASWWSRFCLPLRESV